MSSFKFERYKAFGWIIHRKILETNDTFVVDIPIEYSPSQGHNISLWTKGRVEGIDALTGLPTQIKLPGSSVLQRDTVPVSKNYFKAVEPSEFWCINYTINRRSLPDVEVIKILAGTTKVFDIGTLALFCTGVFDINNVEYIGPKAINFATVSHTVFAKTDTYGFIFKKER